MQELYIDRQPCDLDDGTLITLDIKSNIFTMVDKIESNRTYSVELPRTDTNMRILGNADVLGANTSSPYVTHTCTYISDGVCIINEGTAFVLGITDRIRISVVWGIKDTLQSILQGDIKLTDLQANNAILPYNYINNRSEYSSESEMMSAGYLYAPHQNFKLPEDLHHETASDVLSFAISTYLHPIVPVVRVPWLLGLVRNQYGIGFHFGVADTAIVSRLLVFVSGTNVTEKSVSGTHLTAGSTSQNIIYSTNGLIVKVTASSLEFTNEDGTAINVGDSVNRFKAVSPTTAYVSVSGYTLSGTIQLTPNNIDVLMTLLRTPIYAHNITQGDYKAICKPTLVVDGVPIYKISDLLPFQMTTKTAVFTYTGAVEVNMDSADVLRLWHTGLTMYSGVWNPANFTMSWQTGGTFDISYDIPDRMTVGLNYDIMANLPDVKVIDLIKHLCVVTGCFVRSLKTDTSTLEFVPIDNVFTNPAIDWSDRLLSDRTTTADDVEFTFGEYAQANKYKFKENDDLQFDHDGMMPITNTQLQDETDVFKSAFSTADDYKSRFSIRAWCPYVELPSDWYEVYTGEKTAPSTDADKLCQGTPKATIASSMIGYNSGSGVYYSIVSQPSSSDMQSILNNKYANMYASLNNCKVIKERMMLSDLDIRDFAEDTPVYLSKYGANFAVLEIKRTSGYIADVKLLMLTKA